MQKFIDAEVTEMWALTLVWLLAPLWRTYSTCATVEVCHHCLILLFHCWTPVLQVSLDTEYVVVSTTEVLLCLFLKFTSLQKKTLINLVIKQNFPKICLYFWFVKLSKQKLLGWGHEDKKKLSRVYLMTDLLGKITDM